MVLEKKECEHAAVVLAQTRQALIARDPIKLKELSDMTLHSSCCYQDDGSITAAVLIYTLSKLIERQDDKKIPDWDNFIKKFNSILDITIVELQKHNHKIYGEHMQKARNLLENISPQHTAYIKEVIRKATINKAQKIHDHGISLGKTAQLLGISSWELVQFTAQKTSFDPNLENTYEIKKRAKMALEFFG